MFRGSTFLAAGMFGRGENSGREENTKDETSSVSEISQEIKGDTKGEIKKDEPVWSDGEKRIYLKRLRNTTEQQPSTETLTMDSAVFSAAGKRAELAPVENRSFPALSITLENGTRIECELTDIFFTSLSDFRWMDEERVVLEGHINPSLNAYIIYDLERGSCEEYYGLFFTWDSSCETLYYVQTAPHFAAESIPERILDQNGTVYYETAQGEQLVNSLVMDETGGFMGFFVHTEESGDRFGILNCGTMQVLYEETDVHYDAVSIEVEAADAAPEEITADFELKGESPVDKAGQKSYDNSSF